MKKLIALILFSIVTFSAAADELKNYDSCFILYDVNQKKIVTEYNPNNRCNQQIAPHSTFKVPLLLMAFDQGIANQSTVFKWDGQKRELRDWNQDQTPHTFLKYSAIWVSYQLTSQLGYDRIKQYLADFNYGNQDFSGDPGKNNGLTRAWLGSSLKISAMEQLNFLKAMLSNKLPVKQQAIADTQMDMYQGKLDNGADYYGKTGSGRQGDSKLRNGWFIGFVENGAHQYIFVSNLTDKTVPAATDKAYGSQILKPIVLTLLNDYFAQSQDNKNRQLVPEFEGGLNISKITSCEAEYQQACPITGAKTAMEGIAQQWRCIEKKMAADKSCKQASAIRKLTSYPAIKMKQYGAIGVFYITPLAGGIDTYYMIDTKGHLIGLTKQVDLNQNKQYLRLKQKYPDIALTNSLYWTKINEDLFPKLQTLSNKNQLLLFKQELRDGDCLRCKRVGFAVIAYEFDPQGVFLRSKVQEVHNLSN